MSRGPGTTVRTSTFEGYVRSILLDSFCEDSIQKMRLNICLKGENGEDDIRILFSEIASINLSWLPSSRFIITISELESFGWEEKTFHVSVTSSDDFDFYATSVKIM